MKESLKKTIAFIIALIPPMLAILLGCILLLADTIVNGTIIVTYFVIPISAIILLAANIFSGSGKLFKAFIGFLITIAFFVSFGICYVIGTHEMLTIKADGDIDETYTEVCNGFNVMPKIEELSNYTKLEHYDYYSSTLMIFTCDADTLIVHYDRDEYEKQKKMLEERYVFENDNEYIDEYSCNVGGYFVRILDNDGEYRGVIEYPKKMVMIATNDQECTIAYVAFYDDDLDYIESLETFLLNDCGWKHILED